MILQEFENAGVQYKKIFTEGHVVPSNDVIMRCCIVFYFKIFTHSLLFKMFLRTYSKVDLYYMLLPSRMFTMFVDRSRFAAVVDQFLQNNCDNGMNIYCQQRFMHFALLRYHSVKKT